MKTYNTNKKKKQHKKIKPFLLYYVKALKRETGKVEKTSKIVGDLGVAPPSVP